MLKNVCFFLFLIFFTVCHPKSTNQFREISVIWENNQPAGFSIPFSILPEDFQKDDIDVYISENKFDRTIFGKIDLTDSAVIFRTLIPLTYDLKYRITYQNLLLKEMEVQRPSNMISPQLLSIYPSADTVPANLLKIYLLFSKPMGNSHSLEHLFLVSNGDTLQPFLDLPNELWNRDRTLLTLWLDPGRVKRDLIPNRKLGNPLISRQTYKLIILKKWQDAQGMFLDQNYEKTFYVSHRDEQPPDPKSWTFDIPNEDTRQPLGISFHESLDFSLLQECISVLNTKGERISGQLIASDDERRILFHPEQPWEGGHYRVRISTILEDLAGNNLSRPFDREISGKEKEAPDRDFVFLGFDIGGVMQQ